MDVPDDGSNSKSNQKPEHNRFINKRQLRMGPAPFASFEDLSDEVRSQRVRIFYMRNT